MYFLTTQYIFMKTFLSFLLAIFPYFLFGQICGMTPGQTENHCSFVLGTYDDCDNPCFCHLLESNEHYIPDAESPILEVKLNLHIIAHATDPVGFPNFVEGNEDHEHYLRINFERMEEEIYGGFWNGAPIEERCDDVLTGQLSIDSRIRFTIKDIIWHYGTTEDYSNDGTICGTHTYEQFIEPFPNLYDDALDVLFVENNTGNGGCGQALGGEDEDFILINNAFTARYMAGQDWREKGNLAHELGHAFGLFHPEDMGCVRDNMGYGCVVHDAGGAFTGDFNQVMHGNSSDQRFFTELEVAQMRRYLLTTWRKKWLTEVPQEIEVITINGNETWDEEITWMGDILVPAGSELAINSTLRMQKDRNIFVERGARLIVDEGTITSCGIEKWGGIKVEGFPLKYLGNGQPNDPFAPLNLSNSGIVAIINGGTIDNARNGISTNNAHLDWPEEKQHYGGLIHCDDAVFSNCNRAVEFMKYGNPQNLDKSSFNNSTFIDCFDGVTNWSSDGVTFTNCTFENIEHAATGGRNAAIYVYDGNVFENVQIGVDLVATKKNQLASEIGKEGTAANTFNNTYIGIFGSSINNLNPTNIVNNVFDATVGVQIEGPSNIGCNFNDFSNGLGVFMFDSDNFINRVNNNQFTSANSAISALYDNSFLTFADNCMDFSTGQDVWLYGTSTDPLKINPAQGNQNIGAGNCFTNGTTPDIVTQGTTNSFTYFVPGNIVPTDCLNPETSGNYLIQPSLGTSPQDCGSGLVNIPPSEGCTPSEQEQELVTDIAALDTEIAYLKNNGGNTFQLNEAERCLNKSLKALALQYTTQSNSTAIEQYFSQRSEFQFRTVPFEYHVNREDYVAARLSLNTLSTSNIDEANYKQSQDIYLDFLEQEYFELGPADEQHLLSTGTGTGPLNGYSRAIYYSITNQRIPLDIPSSFEERQAAVEQQVDYNAIGIIPNPVTTGKILINGLSQYFEDENSLTIEIYNNLGQLLFSQELNTNDVHVGSKMDTGLHFVKILNDDTTIHQEKVLFLK